VQRRRTRRRRKRRGEGRVGRRDEGG